MSQSLVGSWQGRPERAAERLARELPRANGDPSANELADEKKFVDSQPTDLELYGDLRIDLTLRSDGAANLALGGERQLTGEWSVKSGEGRRALIEIAVTHSDPDRIERRRFEIELLKDDDQLVLHEEGADNRFGRLIFQRADSER